MFQNHSFHYTVGYRNWDSIGDMVTTYGLDSLEFESQQWQDTASSPKLSVLAVEPKQSLIQWVPGFLLAGKVATA
jgi:hypothetical protein